MSLVGKISSPDSTLNGKINRLYELRGYSAYEIAVINGFKGTEAEWLASLKGDKGDTGPRGEQGPAGADGKAGQNGKDGATGYTPVRGKDYWTEEDQKTIVAEAARMINLEIDYEATLAFDTEEIVVEFLDTSAVLGVAILGKMILGHS